MILGALTLPAAGLLSRIRLGFELAGLALGLFFFVLWRLDAAGLKASKAELAKVKGDLAVAHATITQLQSGIAEQNAAIERWHAEARRQEGRVHTAETKSDVLRRGYEAKLQAILQTPAPNDGNQALDWLVEGTKKLVPSSTE
jgi:hypothetical protein